MYFLLQFALLLPFTKRVRSAPKADAVMGFQYCLYEQHKVRKGKCVTQEQSTTFSQGSDATQLPLIFIPHVQILSATFKLNGITLKVSL